MSDQAEADRPAPDLRQSLRRAADSALALAQVRLELFNTELQLGAQTVLRLVLQVALALLLLLLGLAGLLGFIVWLAPADARVWVLGGLALALCAGAAWLLASARHALRQHGGPFAASLLELRRDREQLAADRE